MTHRRSLPVADTLPPCTSCGACCAIPYDEGTVADLTEQDVARIGPRRLRLYAVAERGGDAPRYATQSVERGDRIVCRAFRGTIGRRCSCRLYDVRPEVCRAFARGSAGCLSARQGAGL